jgi:hypothetical protein
LPVPELLKTVVDVLPFSEENGDGLLAELFCLF